MFSWLLGKKQEKIDTNKNINNLKDQISILEKREGLLLKKIKIHEDNAKKAIKTNKNEAIKHLKNKKLLENQVQSIENQKINLESMVMKLEEAILNVDIIKSQGEASKTLNAIFKDVNADGIDKKMDDIRETFDKAKDISEILNQPLDNTLDSDVSDDLEALELESENVKEINIPSNPLPNKKKDIKKEEEDDLKKLEQELM